ncbi:MAG: tyrosine-type recombinase/integrase [Labedaea sp.]
MIWLAMTTGARRHELCALRWTDVIIDDDSLAVLWIRRGISPNRDGVWAEMDTKTHQQRRVTLDPETVAVLEEHRTRIAKRLAEAGYELADDAFVFSATVDHSKFLTPGAVSQRYERLVDKLGITRTIHKLRHYSATELIKAGVDINTVAGRLGHGGGGTTTLKYYTGWIAEAEQRAAISLGARMPQRHWTKQPPRNASRPTHAAPTRWSPAQCGRPSCPASTSTAVPRQR